MENKHSFWGIYKQNTFSNSRVIPLLFFLGLWNILIFTWAEFGSVQMPKWLLFVVPLLLAELAYMYTCMRKYKRSLR